MIGSATSVGSRREGVKKRPCMGGAVRRAGVCLSSMGLDVGLVVIVGSSNKELGSENPVVGVLLVSSS